MHLVLTDALVCPRCGPDEGLIVLAERMEERRVLEGALGCPSCRSHFPVRAGLADLRGQRSDSTAADAAAADDDPLRLAALLGITDGRGHALLLGGAARSAPAISALLPGFELVAIGPGVQSAEEQTGVSRLLADVMLPFRERSVRGIIAGPLVPAALLHDAPRVLAVGGRLVLSLEQEGAEDVVRSSRVRELARDAKHVALVRLH